jgi:hypothetical protein
MTAQAHILAEHRFVIRNTQANNAPLVMWDLLCLPVWLFSAIGLAFLGIYGHYSSHAHVAYTEAQGVTTSCESSVTRVGASSTAAADYETGKRSILGDSPTRRSKTTFRMGDYLLHVLPLAFSHYLSMPKN